MWAEFITVNHETQDNFNKCLFGVFRARRGCGWPGYAQDGRRDRQPHLLPVYTGDDRPVRVPAPRAAQTPVFPAPGVGPGTRSPHARRRHTT